MLPPRCEKTCKKSLENANKVCMVAKKFACGAHFFACGEQLGDPELRTAS